MTKFIDNFVHKKVEEDVKVTQVSFLDEESIRDGFFDGHSPSNMITTHSLNIRLEQQMERAVVETSPFDGGNFEKSEWAKERLKQTLDYKYESRFIEEIKKVASVENYYTRFSGFKGWVLKLLKYKEMISIDSKEFFEAIHETSHKIHSRSRISQGDWVVLNPEDARIFYTRQSFIQHIEPGERGVIVPSQYRFLGELEGIKVYSDENMEPGRIIMGRTPFNGDLSKTVFGIQGPMRIDTVESHHMPNQMEFYAGRNVKVFAMPESEISYSSWNYAKEKPSFWKWFYEKCVKRLFKRNPISMIWRRIVDKF